MKNDLESQIKKAKTSLTPYQYDLCKKMMNNHWEDKIKEDEV